MQITKICTNLQCTLAGIKQPLTNFYKHPTSQHGRQALCKPCHNRRSKARKKAKRLAAKTGTIQEWAHQRAEDFLSGCSERFKHSAKTGTKAKPKEVAALIERSLGVECRYSGIILTKENISIDHIIPPCYGGKSTIDNLETIERNWNHFKGQRTPGEFFVWLHSQPRLIYMSKNK